MTPHFTDWTSEPGRLVMPGDTIWAVTGEQLQVIRAEMDPGAEFQVHEHPQEQVLVVLEGALEFEVGGERRVVRAGGVIHVPPGVPHGGRVLGAERVVTIESFHPPRRNFGHGGGQMDLSRPE